MYCKNCGCKINTGEKRCSDCGTDIKEIEYCGGFWGLVGEEEKVKTLISIEEKPKEVLERNTIKKREILENRVVQRTTEKRESKKLNEELINSIMIKNKTIRRYKNLKIFLVGVVLILVTVCLLQSVQISQVSKQCEKLYTIYEGLILEHQEFYGHYGELKEQLEKPSISETEENIDLNGQDETEESSVEAGKVSDETEGVSDEAGEVSDETEESSGEVGEVSDETEGASDETGELPEREEKSLNNDPNMSNNLGRQFNQSEREDLANE